MSVTAEKTSSGVAVPRILDRGHRAVTVGLLLLVTLVAFESMAVTTVMNTVARSLHGQSLYAWGFSAFLMSGMVANVVAGQWADRKGPALCVITGVAVFCAGLVAAGSAPQMWWFVAARAIQGFGGGCLVVAMYVVIAQLIDEELRPRMFAATSAAWVVPSLIGPLVGGFIAQNLGWRWVFLGLIPLVIPGLVMLLPALRRTAPQLAGKPPGGGKRIAAVAVAIGAALTLTAADNLRPWSLLPAAVGIALLATALPRLLPRGAFRLLPGLPRAIILRGLVPAVYFGVDANLPRALADVHHFSPTQAGLAITTGSLGWSAGSWFQGRPHPDSRRPLLVTIGLTLMSTGIVLVALATLPAFSGWLAIPGWIIAGSGIGMAMSSLTVLIMKLSPAAEQGANSAAAQVCDTLGSSLSIGAVGAIVIGYGLGQPAPAFIAADIALAAIALGGAALSRNLGSAT